MTSPNGVNLWSTSVSQPNTDFETDSTPSHRFAKSGPTVAQFASRNPAASAINLTAISIGVRLVNARNALNTPVATHIQRWRATFEAIRNAHS